MVIRALSKDDIPQLAGLYFQFWEEDSDSEKMKSAFPKIFNMGLCAETHFSDFIKITEHRYIYTAKKVK